MSKSGIGIIGSSGVCVGDFHAYPKTYAGDPQYAAQYFSRCLCGKKRKVTTVTEIDAPKPNDPVSNLEGQNGA